MAISRPLLFALIGVLVVFAAITAVRMAGGGEDAAPSGSASSTASTTSAPPASVPSGPEGVAASETPAAGSSAKPQTQGAPARPRRRARPRQAVPDRVASALADRRVVVLFFGARGSDDRATREAARTLRKHDAAVFTDSVGNLDEYVQVVGALPLTQVPATVIIDRDRTARVVEGFADSGSLHQLVADAR